MPSLVSLWRNDGSPQVFYFQPGLDATLWVIGLEGGWWCYNEVTCQERWNGDRALMSTVNMSETASPSSLWDPSFSNPFGAGNMVYMPYVTSDGFMGNASAEANNMTWQFRGRPALTAVVEDLFRGFTMGNVTYQVPQGASVVFTGYSAGGFGTLMNTNYVGQLVAAYCPLCTFHSVPDSGLFIGSVPDPLRSMAECNDSVETCSYADEIQIAHQVWGADPFLDPTCALELQALGQPTWHCLFGEIAALYVREKIFVIQYMFDAAELLADDGLDFLNATELTLAEELALAKKALFQKFPSFLPACLGHCMATPHALDTLTIRDVSLKSAISLWYALGDQTSYIDSCSTPECRSGCA